MYYISDARERQEACELLQDCKESIILPLIGHSGLKVEVKGLEIMNDDPGAYLIHHTSLSQEVKMHPKVLLLSCLYKFQLKLMSFMPGSILCSKLIIQKTSYRR